MKSLGTRAWIRCLIHSWFSQPPKLTRIARGHFRLQVERLEDRVVPSGWLVTNTSSNWMTSGSLPWAVAQAQTDTSNATITFSASAFSSATNITLASALSVQNNSHSITIDGSGAGPITVIGGGGYGIFIASGTSTFRSLTLENGFVGAESFTGGGGAIYCSGTTTVGNCIFNGNSAGPTKYGGAIYNAGILTVLNSRFSNNTSTITGGAIENDRTYGGTVTATIENCLFVNNGAYIGAAIDNVRATITVENSTFTGNTGTGTSGGSFGGAIRNFGNAVPGILSVLNCTITNNAVGASGGGIYNSGSLYLENSIVAGNTATANPDVYNDTANSATVTASHNLIGNTAGSGITAGNGNILAPAFVGLGTLGNNGGPTQTIPLVFGSPALGAAGPATTLGAVVGTTTTTTITVANVGRFTASPLPTLSSGSYFTIQIGGEQMAVVGASTSTLTVGRGVNGTTAATHANGAAVYLVSDQRGLLAPYANPAIVNMGASQQVGVLPAVTSVSPNMGTVYGGTSVVIAGSGLTGATAVYFGTAAAASYTVNSDSQITAISPVGSGAVDVTVVTVAGTSLTSSGDQFTYAADPFIAGVSPSFGPAPGGTNVVITGSGFTGATAVMFGSTNATSFVVDSSTQITAISPAGAGTVDITVTTPAGTTITWSFDNFTYIPAPTVTSVSPNFGILAGGTSVTITGTTLTAATAVYFGGTAATSLTVNSATQITAIAPPEGAGTVDITVASASGISPTSPSDQFTYDGLSTVVTTVSDAVAHTGVSLRDAVAIANRDAGAGQSDIITFDAGLNGQTITLVQGLLLLQPPSGTPSGVITILGNNQITIDGNNASSIFELANNAILSGLTIQHANGHAVIGFGLNTRSTLINCTLKNNSCGSPNFPGGSAVYSYYGNMALIDCTISGNTSIGDGQYAVVWTITNMTLVNTTITGNTPRAIEYYANNASITLVNSTITANPSGAIFTEQSPPPPLQITNSILVGNGSQDVGTPNVAVTNYDMIGSGAGSTGTGNILNPANPGLGTLGNNGGPVQTIPLLAGSPALGSGGAVQPLGAAINSTTANTFTLANGTFFAAASMLPLASGYYTIQIDHEQMLVTGLTLDNSGVGTFTVVRGANGATPASHAAGAPIYLVSDARGAVLPSTGTPVVNMGAFNSAGVSSHLQPAVTAVNPNAGISSGGDSVIITGANFTGATAVSFGGTAATSFTINSDTQITATDPAGAGVVDVTVTTPAGGASATSSADQFTYFDTTTTTLTDNGPNPSTFGQAVSFTAAVSGGAAISGDTVTIEDADNANAVVASPTLSGGTVTFTISDLPVGIHHLFAVYNGDATHAGSNDSTMPVTQVVNEPAPAVSSVVVNGGTPAYTDSLGLSFSLAGQNSVVEQILVTFNEAVTLDSGAFSITNNAAAITVHSGESANTQAVAAGFTVVPGSGDTQYMVTFSGAGTHGNGVIDDGLYVLNTIGSKVHANGQTSADNHTGFWTLYGSAASDNVVSGTIGDGHSEVMVDCPDFWLFKNTYNSESDMSAGPPAYNVAMDANLDGFVDLNDFSNFKSNFGTDWSF